MSPLNSPVLVSMSRSDSPADLSTEIGLALRSSRATFHRLARVHRGLRSEAAYFPRLWRPYSSGLNLTSRNQKWGERKESMSRVQKKRGETNQNDSKIRVDHDLLKTPNTSAMLSIDDLGQQRSVEAGEQVMACGAVGGARGYYAV